MSIKNLKILVTGGQGFIGANLVKKLGSLNAEVSTFDLKDGQDITNSKTLETFIKKKFDVIYHLAGYSGSAQSDKNKKLFFEINTFATVNLFELVLKYSPKTKVVISGSRLEYGKPEYTPVDENHPTTPNSAYGLSRLLTTQMAHIYFKKNNLDVTVFRTSNVYGPHSTFKFNGFNIINNFIDIAKNDGELKIYGQGDQLRDYIYVDDVSEAFILAAQSNVPGQIYNLGYGKGIKLIDMVKLIIKNTKQGSIKKVEWPIPEKKVETGDYISDISKINKIIHFSPKISFEQGVKMAIDS